MKRIKVEDSSRDRVSKQALQDMLDEKQALVII
jgi:hypothetical protein